MGEKPTAAFLLSLIGGVFLLFGGFFAIFGIIIIIGAIFMYTQPESAKSWGIVVLILGIISLMPIVTVFGGLLSLIGGILAIVWKPSAPRAAPPPPPP